MFDVRLKGSPNEDLVQGYPGIPATWPRIHGVIEIRPNAKEAHEGSSLKITKVTVGLYRTDWIAPPTNKPSINGSKKAQSFLVTKQKDLWTSKEQIYALDLPFTLSLPTGRPMAASISLGKHVETSYHIFVSVSNSVSAKVPVEHVQFPVRIKRFDTLSTFGSFHKPLVKETSSADHLVSLEYSMPTSAYGPGDCLIAYLKISSNSDWAKARKARLKRISLELVQIVTFNIPVESSAAPSEEKPAPETREKRSRVCKVSKDYDDLKLMDKAEVTELSMDIPGISAESKDGILPKDRPDIPDEARSGFTTAASLYKVEFELVFRARFSHAKDIEVAQPITISEFDHSKCAQYMRNIVEAAELVKLQQRRPDEPRAYSKPIVQGIMIR